jgi:RsiW-degrading membrane proteinase PrsW (M82 family)
MNGPEGLTTKNLMLSLHNFYRAVTAYCIYLAKTEGDFAWSGIKKYCKDGWGMLYLQRSWLFCIHSILLAYLKVIQICLVFWYLLL